MPSKIWVEGSAYVNWTQPRRRRFNEFVILANEFGLHVHDVEVGEELVRKKWTRKRVDLAYAFATIKDEPGILFDDWAKLWEGGVGNQTSRVVRLEARKKAMVALSRLFIADKVEKVRREEDGRLTLWPQGTAPKGRA